MQIAEESTNHPERRSVCLEIQAALHKSRKNRFLPLQFFAPPSDWKKKVFFNQKTLLWLPTIHKVFLHDSQTQELT